MRGVSSQDPSPTSGVFHVLFVFWLGALLALLFGAQGLRHAANGMAGGPMRSGASAVALEATRAQARLGVGRAWQWAQAALGRSPQRVSGYLAYSPDHKPTDPFNPAIYFTQQRWTFRRNSPGPTSAGSLPALRVPSPSDPLRILVTGDSLTGYLGPDLVDDLYNAGPVSGTTDTHDGTGLTSPNFVDWSVLAQQQVNSDNPDAVVVLIGGNDFQNMVTGDGRVLIAGTSTWRAEYQRRAEVCMRIWTQGGTRRVYWLSIPPARNPGWASTDAQINIALRRAAAQVPGARFLDVAGPVTVHGHYSDFVDYRGQQTLVREPDGVHLNETGSQIVANEVFPIIARDWHLQRHR
jgi:lysophospholipase L1-like esterase